MSVTPLTPRRPRVCIVAPEFIGPFPNGGVGTACYWEAIALAEAGFDVTVLYTGPTDRETPGYWERTYGAAGIFAYADLWAWAARGESQAVERAQHPCAEARTSELVHRFLRGRRFDLLLFQEFLGHGLRTLQARQSGEALTDVPAAVTLHSCRQWIYQGMQRVHASEDDVSVDFLERESARLADVVIAPSHHMARWAAAHWPRTPPAVVVPYCYDRAAERSEGRVAHDGPFEHLVFFGRLETRKGLHLFCRALASSDAARGPVRRVTLLGKQSTVEGRPTAEFVRETIGGIPGLQVGIVDTLDSFEALEWLDRKPRTLVVSPSLVDNLPYALIELFTRRIPFVSTNIGGIPEIVGPANAHLLAGATVPELAALLSRVHADGRLEIDYREGYSSARAGEAHVECLRSLLKWKPVTRTPRTSAVDVVIVDEDQRTGADAREALAAELAAQGARELTWAEWLATADDSRPAVFMSAAVVPRRDAIRRLLAALDDPRVDAATSYFATAAGPEAVEIAPLGPSIEAGWTRNVFGGPCFVAGPRAFGSIRDLAPTGFNFWTAYAGLACAGHEIALIPDVLYTTEAVAADDTPEAVESVIRRYHQAGPSVMDIGWVLKHARTGGTQSAAAHRFAGGRGLYDHLLAIPPGELAAYCQLAPAGSSDRFATELRELRTRLAEVARRWRETSPRAFVYGAGEHTRVMLALEPDLGRHVAGFIDRRPIAEFLGRPCVRPEAITPGMADAVLYSSREYERDMHARLAGLPVEHVLLYTPQPAPAEPATAERLRRRFGHGDAPVDALRRMYRPPQWATGFISGGDTEFLLELVSGVQPRRVLELGVASGASSAALLLAMDHLPAPQAARLLHSCDVRPSCYFDASRPTGSAVREMYPGHGTLWTLDTDTDARRLSQSTPPASFDLLFIDANHSHPWPLIDLLHLAEAAAPEAWVALHDIELPVLNPKYQVHGPQWLFEAWPFNKVHGVGASRNIGAVQLPSDLSSLVPMALALLERPWEHAPTAWDVDLPKVFADVTAALAPRLAAASARAV